jgi:mono/diheme cytochrome c family protein
MRMLRVGGLVSVVGFVVSHGLTVGTAAAQTPRPRPTPVPSHSSSATPSLEATTALVRQYCVTCHNDRAKAGGLTLASFEAIRATENLATAETMIRKLRSGMMPPAGAKRPAEPTLLGIASALETHLDSAAAANRNPGVRPFQRLNRAEYGRSVRDLLGLEVDVAAFLPPDTISSSFDNVADVQSPSATLWEGFVRAASRIATLAIGDRHARASEATYRVPRTASQMRRVDGAPLGTRGGISVTHIFPADGEYSFRIMLHSSGDGTLFGGTARGEQLEVSINGARVALLDINPRMSEADASGMNLHTPRVPVKAGPQRVTAAFIQRFKAPADDLMSPIEHTLADSHIGLGVTALPHLRDLNIMGPHVVTGISDNVSRRAVFICRPTDDAEELPCAKQIVRSLAERAYRGPVSDPDFAGLMGFYERGRQEGDFESGVRMALQAILASPRFLFRFEEQRAAAEGSNAFRIGELELASRLSYFLWSTLPDETLIALASKGQLRSQLTQQVRRMLADARAEALSTRFATLWLRLNDLEKIRPDALLYPYFDYTLGEAMAEETRRFFDHLVREDRSLLELLTADYTFVNEQLARHYGIPGVAGSAFRRVPLTGSAAARRGILGHGSILTLTSVADRTSPVLRGKWIMEVLLGSPPPPPPPNVPELEEVEAAHDGRLLSVRERMAQHRANPACNSCHRVIDPLGLALENFDVTGRARIKDNGQPIDASGELYDGTKIDGPAGLQSALLKRKDTVVLSFTESLMTYAIGRRIEPFDMPAVRAIVREAATQDYKMSAFILGIISSPAFQMRAIERVETAAQR